MKNQRNKSLDILCGVLIVHMISAHIFQNAKVDDCLFFHIQILLFFFFMPWFFFKNGMFFKYNTDKKVFVHKSFRRLMIPFFAWGGISMLFWFFKVAIGEHGDDWKWYIGTIKALPIVGTFESCIPLWFLLSLFIVRVVYNSVCFSNILTWLLVIISVTVPFVFHCIGFDSLYSISHTLLGFFFFHWGYSLKERQYCNNIFAMATIICIAVAFYDPLYLEMVSNKQMIGNCYLLNFPYAIAAIIVFNNYFKHLPLHISNHSYSVVYQYLESIGRNSMNYYVTHWILLLLIKIIMINILGLSYGWTMFWIMITACVIILPLLSMLLNLPRFDTVMGRKK